MLALLRLINCCKRLNVSVAAALLAYISCWCVLCDGCYGNDLRWWPSTKDFYLNFVAELELNTDYCCQYYWFWSSFGKVLREVLGVRFFWTTVYIGSSVVASLLGYTSVYQTIACWTAMTSEVCNSLPLFKYCNIGWPFWNMSDKFPFHFLKLS